MRIYIFIISLFFSFVCSSQETIQQDSISTKKKSYGLRIGTDISKLIKTALRKNYTAFEINGDFRFSKKYYAAAEIGFEDHLIDETQTNLNTKGTYIKLGIDYNAYENWLDMENVIFAGLRYSFSTYQQTLNSYSIQNLDQYWGETTQINTPQSFSGSSSHWIELIVGIKAEIFNNFYLGLNAQLKNKIINNTPDNLDNLYIPGFGRTYKDSNWGVGFAYTINYLLPIYKK